MSQGVDEKLRSGDIEEVGGPISSLDERPWRVKLNARFSSDITFYVWCPQFEVEPLTPSSRNLCA